MLAKLLALRQLFPNSGGHETLLSQHFEVHLDRMGTDPLHIPRLNL